MTERGMIFNSEMVRAILDGRKTQTRRIIKLSHERGMLNPVIKGRNGEITSVSCRLAPLLCPFGQPEDRIWVRETWAEAGASAPDLKLYRANYPDHVPSHYENVPPVDEIRWKPSIHMPRWASRILLGITDVRVERLNAISQADAIAEGAPPSHPSIDCVSQEYGFPDFSRSWFGQTWQHIYGEESWQANPWVWVIEFKQIDGVK
ncbi:MULTISPECIES: ASCH domain-containing protein [Citrobacter freundii complex]|uniref:hypothetical protein n=1 Tax=Citrobacter freundii complex TaxID=1344959 RepID=UPI001A33CFBF|nr:hypothetical protein [Citrobacter portucalensis]MDK2581817.1 hypothetical protein [Citrobacter portucalensis]HAT2543034.1 hypothetical protein [Citrobacter freundii]